MSTAKKKKVPAAQHVLATDFDEAMRRAVRVPPLRPTEKTNRNSTTTKKATPRKPRHG